MVKDFSQFLSEIVVSDSELQARIAELEQQKEQETIILERFNEFRIKAEKAYSQAIRIESLNRINYLNNEISKTKELIKLQQEA